MTTSTLITLIVAVLGSGGLATIITALVNAKRNQAQSETEARAQYATEFDVLAKNLSDEIKRQDVKIERLDETVQGQGKTIAEQGEHIRKLQNQEWTLKRFILRLMEKIKELGGEPPDPPFDMTF